MSLLLATIFFLVPFTVLSLTGGKIMNITDFANKTCDLWHTCVENECCYSYGSVPRNDSNCVQEAKPFTLTCSILNPHDTFTNLSVRWFKRLVWMKDQESIINVTNEYYIGSIESVNSSIQSGNCSQSDTISRSIFSVHIQLYF